MSEYLIWLSKREFGFESLRVRVSESECLKGRMTSEVWILGFKWSKNEFL